MLTKRTNILFDQEMWEYLVGLAAERKSSVGELVRTAVKEKFENEHEQKRKKRADAVDNIIALRKKIKHKFTFEEIRELIEDGRRY